MRFFKTGGSVILLALLQSFTFSMRATAQAAAAASAVVGGSIQGVVKSGDTAIPGATVTASNTLTGQKVTTWTNVAGQYSLQVPANGRYVVKAQMAAFATITGEGGSGGALALAVADRVLFMDQGEIVEDNEPANFFDAPRTERARRFLSQMIHK